MPRKLRSAAAWTAPIQTYAPTLPKRPRLKPMTCVMWLPDYGGYIKTMNRWGTRFTVTQSPTEAMRLGEDQAEQAGQDVARRAGVRVHLRPFNAMH